MAPASEGRRHYLMARKLMFLSIVACLMIGAAQGVFAHDHFLDWPGHWVRGADGTTTEAWEFGGQQGPSQNNPYGTPELDINNGVIIPGTSLLIGSGGGDVGIHIPNRPVLNDIKWLFIQVTSDTPIIGSPIIAAPGTVTEVFEWAWAESSLPGFTTYAWLDSIVPNPNFEDISLYFLEGTNVDEIVIDTECVPEPMSIVLGIMGLGSVAGFRRLRRK
jgi:hypothetical protein